MRSLVVRTLAIFSASGMAASTSLVKSLSAFKMLPSVILRLDEANTGLFFVRSDAWIRRSVEEAANDSVCVGFRSMASVKLIVAIGGSCDHVCGIARITLAARSPRRQT